MSLYFFYFLLHLYCISIICLTFLVSATVCLRFKRIKNRMKRADDKRRKIQDTISIDNRSESANNRTEPGHWESDTVLGKHGTGCIGTHVERKTGFLVGFKIPDRKNDVFNKATIALFENMPYN